MLPGEYLNTVVCRNHFGRRYMYTCRKRRYMLVVFNFKFLLTFTLKPIFHLRIVFVVALINICVETVPD